MSPKLVSAIFSEVWRRIPVVMTRALSAWGVSLAIHLSLSLNHNVEPTITALTGALHGLAKAATGAQ